MNAPSLRGNTLCLAVAAALAVSLAPMAAVAAETVIIRDAELEFIQPVTYGHAEIYDSRVINHASGSGAGREAVRIDRGNLRMERTEVVTRGDEMSALSFYGAEYYNNGVVYDAVIVDSDVRTSGDKAVGLLFSSTTFDSSTGALDKVGQITVQGSTVSTTGVQSHAMGVAGVNAVDVTGTQFTTAGQGAAGVSMMGGILAMRDGSSVATTGDGAHGIHARSMRWSTSGRPGVVYRADVTLVDSTVTTFGAGSVGILAGYQDNGTPIGIGARLRLQHAGVRSAQSHAVQFLRGQDNTLDLGAGSVLDGGDAVVFAGEADSINRVTATDSSFIGRGAQALVADNGARLGVQLDNSDVQVASGMGLAHARSGAAIDIHATGSRLQGSVQADEGASLAVQLDSSRWNAWGPSQLDQLSLRNGSVLALGAGSVGDRLIVRGDLRIEDSTLAFDSALGDDGSPTDHLWVKGDTAGRGAVVVNNAGGRGGQTVDGIQLIRVDGVSAAALTLTGRAVGGPYEYFLFKGSHSDPADGHWYLRSELQPETDPCATDPTADGCTTPSPDPCLADPGLPQCIDETLEPELRPEPETGPAPQPVLRPEPGAYLANQRAAVQMFASTAQDRDAVRGGSERGAWAMVSGSRARYGAVADQLHVRGDSVAVQVGTDVLHWGQVGRGQLGVMVGSGRATNTSTSRLTAYRAHGKVSGQVVGVYGQWRQTAGSDRGLYAGAALQHARFDNSVQGEALRKERYDSRGTAASVEVGYAFALVDSGARALYVQPQVQLRHTAFDADPHTETNGTVIDGAEADGLSSRVGVRVFGHANTAGHHRVQPYVAVDWIRESGDNRLRFDGERVAGGVPRDRVEASAGAQVRLGSRWSAWGDTGWQRGDGGCREATASLGLRAAW